MKRWLRRLCSAAGGLVGLALLGFGGSYLAYSGQYQVPATTGDDPALPSRNVAGYRFHLEVFGLPTRPVVIVLHGGPGGDYRSLLPLRALSDDYQLVFYDQRGSGLSPRVPDDQLGLDQHLADLHDVIESLSPHAPVRLVGHGWGAMLAAAYLDRHPEQVSHAALLEPPFLTAERGNQWWAATQGGRPPLSPALLAGTWRALMQSLYVYGPDEDARRDFLRGALLELDVPHHPLAGYHCAGDPYARSLAWRTGTRAADALELEARQGSSGFTLDWVQPSVKRYPHKVLLVAGSCDRIIGPEAQRENARLFANAELAVIEGAGHTMIGEKPPETILVLRRYLDEDHSAIVASD